MIEVFLAGDYRGTPHDIGAWAYLLRRGDDLLGRGQGRERPEIVTCRLATEAAALALALERLIREWPGEEVAVRSSSAGLEGLLLQQGAGAARDVTRWYQRIREAAEECSLVRIAPPCEALSAALRNGLEDLLPQGSRGITVCRAAEILPAKRPKP